MATDFIVTLKVHGTHLYVNSEEDVYSVKFNEHLYDFTVVNPKDGTFDTEYRATAQININFDSERLDNADFTSLNMEELNLNAKNIATLIVCAFHTGYSKLEIASVERLTLNTPSSLTIESSLMLKAYTPKRATPEVMMGTLNKDVSESQFGLLLEYKAVMSHLSIAAFFGLYSLLYKTIPGSTQQILDNWIISEFKQFEHIPKNGSNDRTIFTHWRNEVAHAGDKKRGRSDNIYTSLIECGKLTHRLSEVVYKYIIDEVK